MQKELFDVGSLVGKILHAQWGYNATNNTFLLVLEETDKTIVAAEIRRELVSGDATAGAERPMLPVEEHLTEFRRGKRRIRMHKKTSSIDGSLYFTYDFYVFGIWDGQDKYFNSD